MYSGVYSKLYMCTLHCTELNIPRCLIIQRDIMLGTGFADPGQWASGALEMLDSTGSLSPSPIASPARVIVVTSVLPTQNEDRIAAKVRDARTLDTFYLFSTILIHCIIVKLFFVNFAPARMETILTSNFA